MALDQVMPQAVYPHPIPDREYPHPGDRLHPVWNWMGYSPGRDLEPVKVLWDGDGVPPWKGHGSSGS